MNAICFAAAALLSLAPGTPALAQPRPQLSAQPASQPTTQTITIYNFGFTPRAIHLAAGKPVTLTFVNQSGSGHDFTAKAFFAAAKITAGVALNGSIELPPHQSATITLTPRAGHYPARCTHFLHKQFGMTATIVVD